MRKISILAGVAASYMPTLLSFEHLAIRTGIVAVLRTPDRRPVALLVRDPE